MDNIPKYRIVMFYLGTIIMVLGNILSLSTLFAILLFRIEMYITAPIGLIMIIIGILLRSAGSHGLDGSGWVLKPKQAREDSTIIKVRCKNCNTLNDEDSKYCKNCGLEI